MPTTGTPSLIWRDVFYVFNPARGSIQSEEKPLENKENDNGSRFGRLFLSERSCFDEVFSDLVIIPLIPTGTPAKLDIYGTTGVLGGLSHSISRYVGDLSPTESGEISRCLKYSECGSGWVVLGFPPTHKISTSTASSAPFTRR